MRDVIVRDDLREHVYLSVLAVAMMIALSSCSLFSTRSPEDPVTEAGTYSQPDTPEQVIENIETAVSEMNALNYRRSLSDALKFQPTATAEARESVFANWGRTQEEQYFTSMAAAASLSSGHGIALNDRSFAIVSDSRYVLDATYVLTVNHRRPDAPTEVQGRLRWIIEQGTDGLWILTEWTDQELGSIPSWSDLKAEFIN